MHKRPDLFSKMVQFPPCQSSEDYPFIGIDGMQNYKQQTTLHLGVSINSKMEHSYVWNGSLVLGFSFRCKEKHMSCSTQITGTLLVIF